MEFLNSTTSINHRISSPIPFLTWKNKINPSILTIPTSRKLALRPSFPLYLFPSRKFQISAHFDRPTNRKNYLRKKLAEQQPELHKVSNLENPVHKFDKFDNFDSSSEISKNVEKISSNDDNYEDFEGVKEPKTELPKKQFGESIMWNKLENWVEQYKKDSEFWGVGSGPIFSVYQDSEGKVERVVVNEDEILRRSRVDSQLDNENEDSTEVDYKLSFAKDLAKEMESGSNVIPKNSSVAKFLVSGEKSRVVEATQGVKLKPISFSKMSKGGLLVLCGLFVVWSIRGFFTIGKKDVKKELTSLEKEMLRRKKKARDEKERMVRGSVEVMMQDPIETKIGSFERPQLDKEELVNTIIKAKGLDSSEREIVEYSGYQDKEFSDKIEEIRAMARRAREIEKKDSLTDNGDEVDDSENDVTNRNKVNGRESTEKDEIGQSNNEITVEKNEGHSSNIRNVVIPNGTENSRPEISKSSDFDGPESQPGPRENSPRKKLRIIKSAKEAREYLSRKHDKPEINQQHEVTNDEQTVNSLNGVEKSRISLGREVSASNQNSGISVFEIPGKKETDIKTSEKCNGENEVSSFLGSTPDSTSAKVDFGGSIQKEEVLTPLEKHNSEDTTGNEVNGRTEELAVSVNKENWIEKNFHEFEPIVKKIGVGFRDNYSVAREKASQELVELKSDGGETELDWMKDERLREIVFKVRDNELSGRDPFHLMTEDDKIMFFSGLEKKVEQENEKLQNLHEYFHSNIENLDYGADGISMYDPPEKIIPRWKVPPAETNPEFLNNFVEQRKTFVAEGLKNSFLSKKPEKNPVHKSEVSSSQENSPTEIEKKPLVSSKTVIEGSDGSIRAGKKSGKEYWQHTKKWSEGFVESYNAESDPEVKAVMKDMGKGLDRWITEKEIKEAADLMDKIPEKGQKFIKQKLDKVKREMELFGPQAVVSKYSEYSEEKEEDYLWWLDLACVLCIELYTIENEEQRVGFYSLEMAPDLELEPKPYHVIAFEDARDSKNLCYIIQAQMEVLGNGNAFVVARPPKDAFREAKANGFGVTVIRKGQLQLNIDLTLEEVEESIVEIGSKMYHDKITKERSVDINGLMKGVFGVTKPTNSKRKRTKRKTKRRLKP